MWCNGVWYLDKCRRMGLWGDCIMGRYCDNRKALSSYLILMTHVVCLSCRSCGPVGLLMGSFWNARASQAACHQLPVYVSPHVCFPAGVSQRWGSWFLWWYIVHPGFRLWRCPTRLLYNRQEDRSALHQHSCGPGWGIGQVWLDSHCNRWCK